MGDVSEKLFNEQLERVEQRQREFVVVAEPVDAPDDGSAIVACGTLVIEHKFIHGGRAVGHIEDIVVLSEARGQGLGLRVVRALMEEALRLKCYKVILDCDEKNVGFYEKLGMKRKEVQMVKYF